jgi:hypothetical protein
MVVKRVRIEAVRPAAAHPSVNVDNGQAQDLNLSPHGPYVKDPRMRVEDVDKTWKISVLYYVGI